MTGTPFMGSSTESVLMVLVAVTALGAILYMVIDSLRTSRRQAKEAKGGGTLYVAEEGGRPPAKSFVGPGGEKYREDADIDMTNVILATSPDLMNTVAANVTLSTLKKDVPAKCSKESTPKSSSTKE